MANPSILSDTFKSHPPSFAAALTSASNMEASALVLSAHGAGSDMLHNPIAAISRPGTSGQKPLHCFYCKQPGHIKRECHKLDFDNSRRGNSNYRPRGLGVYRGNSTFQGNNGRGRTRGRGGSFRGRPLTSRGPWVRRVGEDRRDTERRISLLYEATQEALQGLADDGSQDHHQDQGPPEFEDMHHDDHAAPGN